MLQISELGFLKKEIVAKRKSTSLNNQIGVPASHHSTSKALPTRRCYNTLTGVLHGFTTVCIWQIEGDPQGQHFRGWMWWNQTISCPHNCSVHRRVKPHLLIAVELDHQTNLFGWQLSKAWWVYWRLLANLPRWRPLDTGCLSRKHNQKLICLCSSHK